MFVEYFFTLNILALIALVSMWFARLGPTGLMQACPGWADGILKVLVQDVVVHDGNNRTTDRHSAYIQKYSYKHDHERRHIERTFSFKDLL